MNKHFRFSGNTFRKMEEHGVRASEVLRRAGLSQALAAKARVLLTTEELFALWRAVGEASVDPAIGLHLGTETKTERFNPVGLAALSTENFGAAIEKMARYKQLTCPEEIRQENEWRRVEHSVSLAAGRPDRAGGAGGVLLRVGAVGGAARHGDADLSTAGGTHPAPRAHGGARTPLRMSGRLWSTAQRTCLSCSRRTTAVPYPQRRTAGVIGSRVRAGAEAGERRGELRGSCTRCGAGKAGRAASHDRGHRARTAHQLTHLAAPFAGSGIEFPARAGRRPPSTGPHLSSQLRLWS